MCKTCNGNGQLSDVCNSTNPYRTCPVCNGSKIIIVTETITDNITALDEFIKPTKE